MKTTVLLLTVLGLSSGCFSTRLERLRSNYLHSEGLKQRLWALRKYVQELERQTGNNYSVLSMAIQHDDMDVVDALLDNHPDLSEVDVYGETPLCVAARKCNLSLVRRLLILGAKPASSLRNPIVELCTACRAYEKEELECKMLYELVKMMIQLGAPINTTPDEYNSLTPLMATRCVRVAELLVLHGACINTLNASGGNALMVVLRSAPISLIRFLVAEGTDLDNVDMYGKTVLDYALLIRDGDLTGASKEEIVTLLREQGAKTGQEINSGRE